MAETKRTTTARRRKAVKPEPVEELIKSEGTVAVTAVIILTVTLALGSFTLSFGALEQLAKAAAVTPWAAWIWPVIVDGFIVLATISSYVLRNRSNRMTRSYPWFALILFAIVSIAGNAYHAYLNLPELLVPIWVAALVNSAPAVALLLASHLLVIMLQSPRQPKKAPAAVEPVVGVPQNTLPVVPQPQSKAVRDVMPVAVSVAQENPPAVVIAGESNELNPESTVNVEMLDTPDTESVPTAAAARKAPAPSDASLLMWATERMNNNETITPADIVEFLGGNTSLRTGQRKLKTLRERSNDVDSYLTAGIV